MTRSLWIGSLLCLPGLLQAQTLQHRYSFTSDASDSVGGANGTLMGNASVSGGQLILPGGTTSGDSSGSYVQLPNALVQSDSSITIETWLTDNSSATWAEAWCFGDSAAGPGQPPNNGTYYFGLIPHAGRAPFGMFVAFNNSLNEIDIMTSQALPTNSEQFVCVTYDEPSATANLYLNGALVGTANVPADHSPATYGATFNDWLGRDQFGGDPLFDGSIDELRIWNAAVSPLYLELSTAAGPNTLVTNLTPKSVTVAVTNTSMIGAQTQQASVTATFQQLSSINVTGGATNWSSSNPGVLTVSPSGLITAQGGGTATVSATVGGVTASSTIITVAQTAPSITQQPVSSTNYAGETATFTVGAVGGNLVYQWSKGSTPIPGATNATLSLANVSASDAGSYSVVVSNSLGHVVSDIVTLNVLQPTLVHEWSFNSLNTDGTVPDLVGSANGTLENSATVSGGQLQLPGGTTSGDPNGSYMQLPDGIVSNLVDISVECWLTDTAGSTWAEAWCFGDSTGGPGVANSGTNYMGLIPHSGPGDCRAAINVGGEEDTIWPNTTLPLNQEEYVVYTSDAASHTGWLYVNGVLVGVNTGVNLTPADMGDTFNNWIGRDQFAGDPLFTGSIDELRIWNAAVSPLYLELSQAAGPDTVINNTTPTSLTVTVTNTSMIDGQTQQASVTGNFAQVSGVTVTGGVSAWASSNPAVLTVSATGLITAVGPGTATVSATVGGVAQSSATITVSDLQPTFNSTPVSAARFVGQSVTFSGSAVGGNLHYQWSKGSTAIPGATNTSLSLSDLALSDAGTYTLSVSNSVGNTSASATLAVTEPYIVHRWSFNVTNSDNTTPDSVGGADGMLENSAVISNNAVYLAGGTTSGDPSGAYVQLPDGIVSNLNSITVECWVTDNEGATWAEIWDFGDSTGGPGVSASGTNYLALIPHSGPGDLRAAFHLQNEQDVTWPATTLETNVEEDVVLTYDAVATTARLFVNGVQVGINTGITITPASLGDTFNNWLGRDDWSGDPYFKGSIDELRIYDGALLPSDVANNHAGGPDTLVAPGTAPVTNIGISRSGSSVVLTWSSGTLLQASAVTGPWTTNTTAASPYTVPAGSGSQFFKVLLAP